MSDQRNDLSMYRDLQGQWSNLQDENSFNHMKRNDPSNGNEENLQNHQDFRMQNQYVHQDMYSPNMHFTAKACDNLTGNPSPLNSNHNFNESIFANQNSNYDVDNRQNFGCVDWSNGQILNSKPMYDNNQQQFVVNSNNYEPFNQDMSHNMPLQQPRYPMMVNYVTPHHSLPPDGGGLHLEEPYQPAGRLRDTLLPPQYSNLSPNHQVIPDVTNTDPANTQYVPTYDRQPPKTQLLDNFLGNWSSNPSGTYTPFGHSFLNVQPNLVLQRESPGINVAAAKPKLPEQSAFLNNETETIKLTEQCNRKEPESFFFSDTTGKKRIVAEVKPMRPSYSAVLSKTPKGQNITDGNKKKNFNNKDQVKPNMTKPGGMKSDKLRNHVFSDKTPHVDDKSKKCDNGRKTYFQSQVSSGSESGETNNEFPLKSHKFNSKNKGKNDMSRKWVSLDDLSNDNDPPVQEKPGYTNCDSEFVLVSQPDDKSSAKKRNAKKQDTKKNEKPDISNNDFSGNEADPLQETFIESDKLRRKTKDRSSNSAKRILSEKNKKNSQNRQKKSKGSSYMAKFQYFVDNWIIIMKNILLWFIHLVSDIFRMSAQLSVDLFSMTCKNTYLWASDLWIFIKDKATSTSCLCSVGGYIDKKIGHTWFGFWRKLKWMKLKSKFDDEKESQKKSNSNIPLPATGDDAMKRLLACKGKDPYSILGVGVQCSDDDIKRYYRRQAFLVHPDKNQQPGAEEAFKILQHAFELIGEPERREAYDRKLVESAHMEAAWSEVSELLAQLHDKVRHAAATIRCTNCSRRHARTLSARPAYAARYCHQCKIHHSAKEGDIWAESSFWGFNWMYYACMDGAVYQITQWASCQKKNLKHLVANSHHVQYRIVLGNKSQPSNGPSAKQNFSSSSHEINLEDFLNNLYTKAGQPTPGGGRNMPPTGHGGDPKNKRKSKKNKL